MKTRIIQKVLITFVTTILISSGIAKAQIFTGGDFSVNWNNGWYVDIAPIIGYQYKNFKVGLSPVGSYSGVGDLSGVYSFGGRVFTEYTVWKGIFLHAEFETLNTETYDGKRVWAFAAPVGVGYEHRITDHIMAQGMVLWDFLQDKNSPKENPIIRGGIVYSF